jgi:hypothetical protein
VHLTRAAAMPQIQHGILDSGGRRTAGGTVVLDGSLGGLGGPSSGASIVLRAGYAGQLNEAPAARNDAIERPSGSPTKLQIAKLRANDTDSEADLIVLTLPGGTSANGGTVSLSEGWIFYIPPTGLLADTDDVFTYLASDAYGTSSLGRVFVVVANPEEDSLDILNPPNRLRWERIGDQLAVTFVGIPGAEYKLQFRASLMAGDSWSDFPNVENPFVETAGPGDGVYTFSITLPDDAQGYFRAVPRGP